MSDWTDIKRLSVGLSDGSGEAVIYGNGRHQVAVTVSFIPIDGDGDPVEVTGKQLQDSVTLVDFVSGEPLSETLGTDDWCYSFEPNNYFRPFPAQLVAASDLAADAQQITLYVTCGSEVRNRILSVAARVQPTASSQAVDCALRGKPESKVTLKALRPFIYTMSEVNWDMVDKTPADAYWTQINYYFSMVTSVPGGEGRIFKATIQGYNSDEDDPDKLYRSFYFLRDANFPYDAACAFVWPLKGKNETAVVLPNEITVDISPRQGAITVVHVGLPAFQIMNDPFFKPLTIKILDEYGNSGTFTVIAGLASDDYRPTLVDGELSLT